MKNDLASLAISALVLGTILNCSQSHLGGGDGESHFLSSCEASCEGGLQCVCGVCTRVCDETDDCKELPGDAVCVAPDQLYDARQCRSNVRIDESVCYVRCEIDSDCATLGEGFTCLAGFCRDNGYSEADRTPTEDAGGEAGAGTGGSGEGIAGGGGESGAGGEGGAVTAGITSTFIATRKYPGPCTDEYDFNRDGTADTFTTYSYDAEGNVLTIERDGYLFYSGADGTMDWRATYTYDENGNMLTEEIDIGASGSVDERTTYTYDADGNILTKERDTRPAGTVDEVTTYTYDEYGNVMTEEIVGSDGTRFSRYAYIYDGYSNVLTRYFDDGADGTVDEATTYTYDEHGNVMTEEIVGSDGTVSSRYTYIYDEYGNLLTQKDDANSYGRSVDLYTYTYDCWE